MKTSKIVTLFVSLIIVGNVHAVYNYNAPNPNSPDGSWKIGFYIPDSATVDYFSPDYPGEIPNPGTRVNLVDGGSIMWDLVSFNHSSFLMSGGYTGGCLLTYDYGMGVLDGGRVGYHLESHDSSKMYINGGIVSHYVWAYDNSETNISGGTIGYFVESNQNSRVNITGGYGTGGTQWLFAHNESSMTIRGDFDSNYLGDLKNAPFSVWGYNDAGVGRWFGYFTGTYANGDDFALRYEIYDDAQIILAPIPEPCTLSLLAIGGLLLRKRKRK